MIALGLAVGAAIYATAEKVHDHKKKKSTLKSQEAPRHGVAESVSIIDDKVVRGSMEHLPPYQKETLPPYH